ncbi:molybdopterin synthase [Natronomonas salina]|uniref:molybdopterin synthase n=1 Tax=Natronomonas salina TaxID=1710540 RepID=UPI0015B3A388|nr:molybdopterin synthase [Natronomonas salina]QLD90623.1 molybdopterin synthase [Natronomonas salina]
MYAFAVLGDGAEDALERLLPELDGRVGTVRVGARSTDGGVAAVHGDTEYVLDDGWRASGDGLTLGETLDRLAPNHDYAAVIGTADGDLPAIVVDGHPDDQAEPLVAVDDAADLDADAVVDTIRATEPHETLESLVADIKRSSKADYAGAIATFTGRVRAKEDADDERTRFLEFEKYEGVAEERMRTIESELEERDGILDVRLHHRTGRIPDGEDIVFVVVLAGHRREAFRAVEDGIDRLKDEVPLFKKEVTEGDTFWVHEREEARGGSE